jgi:spermidine/putrescine transport system permease protein
MSLQDVRRADSFIGIAALRLVPVGGVITFGVIIPLLGLAFFSILSSDGGVTLENYAKFLTTGDPPLYPRILLRSVLIALVTTALTILLTYPAAYFLAFHVKRAKHALLLLIALPFWTSYLLRVFSWKVILGYNGVLNSGLLGLGLVDEPVSAFLYNPTAVVIALTHAWIPFAIMPLFLSLEKIDRSLIEAAEDLGYGKAGVFFRVILPLSMPGVASACCLVFIPTVADYVTAAQVGGTSSLMIGNVIQSLFGKADNPMLGAAISLITVATATLVALLAFRLARPKRRARD